MNSLLEDRFQQLVAESSRLFEQGNYDECIEMFSEAIAYAKILKREKLLLKLMLKRSDSYYQKGDFKLALKHCNEISKYIDKMDSDDLIDYHEIRSIALVHLGNYEDAITEYQHLIRLPNSKAQFKAYVGLGLIFFHQAHYLKEPEKFDTALFYYEKALRQNIDQQNTAIVLHNIGMVYYEKGSYQKALARYFESLLSDIEEYKPFTYNEIAKVYLRLHELKKASDYIDKAAAILADWEKKDNIEIARNFFVKALYYKELKEYETAIFFFKLAMNELKDREIIAEIAEVFQELVKVYEVVDPERAIEYQSEYKYYLQMLN